MSELKRLKTTILSLGEFVNDKIIPRILELEHKIAANAALQTLMADHIEYLEQHLAIPLEQSLANKIKAEIATWPTKDKGDDNRQS